MNRTEIWKNFNMGEELDLSGVFIYNGLRRFHDLKTLNNNDEIFEVLYNLSVGIERLMKIAIIFIEHDDASDQEEFEKSLITHNHLVLLKRIGESSDIQFDTHHHNLLALLAKFYRTMRYDRYLISSAYQLSREREELHKLLNKHLGTNLQSTDSIFAIENTDRFRKHINKLVIKISREIFDLIRDRASKLNLYTDEMRYESKAARVFLRRNDEGLCVVEDVLQKELLLFLMNSDAESKTLEFLRAFEPLDFDPALIGDYVSCLVERPPEASVLDELESLYEEIPKPGERFKKIGLIANPAVDFENYD